MATITPSLPAKMPEWDCLRCGHHWTGHKLEKPRACARCKTFYWDRAPLYKRKKKRSVLHRKSK